jgi:hypothetical protein
MHGNAFFIILEFGSQPWLNLSAICEPIVYTMWEPQHLTTL